MTTADIIPIRVPTPFAVGDVIVYLVKGDALTLIDAGPNTKEAAEVLKEQLASIHIEMSDIEQIVLTHHHADHAGLLDVFSDDIKVIGHPFNEPYISRDKAFMEWQKHFFQKLLPELGVPFDDVKAERLIRSAYAFSCTRSLTQTVTEGMKIDGMGDWTVLEMPGHAESHIVLFHEKTGRMLGGDLLLANSSSNPILEAPKTGEKRSEPLLNYQRSLRRLSELAPNTVFPGHGETIGNVRALIKKRFDKQSSRTEDVRQMLSEKPLTAFQVCQQLFPAVYEKELFLTMSETVGHLDILAAEAGITSYWDGKTAYFRAIER
ncbi:MBL fold metallo-hydrolase [Bacillus halotolerans]|uniref:MBL fold metallo-hydrolase n=1 Tax=Bacillus halotolerans TaxID=260554 RepID=UPI00039C4AAE|nr:MBL fold metallo-hydrolase [Bacillus halotolerans]MBV5122627.1 MBL fold metallo-hydrolase [Bacillus halotolerans]MDG0766965.1 MBL fold metallo-hydrolase [Bacillus halotolerans]MDG3074142.1 MBL fold metallo-hydrolase [Bacillus halotolerans]UUI82835.1 MBL fold metallo-hydrolase [Bacillus halotolerans]UYO30541.1 MBL fold metallo-hydrolase [Bacillus halotolerans]